MPYGSPKPLTDAHAQERTLFAWLLLATVVLLGAMAAPFYYGYIYAGDDLSAYHLPARAFYAKCLAENVAFDWWPDLYAGFYLTGEGQAGTYHPLHLLLYRFLPLRAAFCLELLLSYPALIAGTFFFLRAYVRRDAALFGGMLLGFSSFALLHFVHVNAVAVVAHIPWLLIAIRHLLLARTLTQTLGPVLAISALTGSQLLLGYPQYVWFSLIAETVYTCRIRCKERACRGLTTKESSFSCKLTILIIAKFLGLLLGSVQLLPTIESLQNSTRDAATREFAMTGSLHPWNLLQLVAPYATESRVVGGNTHELGLYLGAAPLMLLLWGIGSGAGSRRSRQAFWISFGLGALALVYAFGQYGPLYPLQTKLPLIGRFRFPCRGIVLAQFCFASATAITFHWLLQRRPNERSSGQPYVLPCIAFAVSVVVAMILPVVMEPISARSLLVWAGPCLMGVACVLLISARQGRTVSMVALALFSVADLAVYGFSDTIFPNATDPQQLIRNDELPPGPGRVALDLATPLSPGLRAGNKLALAGVARVDGYAGLEPARRGDYYTVEALRAVSTHWVLRSAATDAIEGLLQYGDRWLKVPDPLPEVRLTRELDRTGDDQKILGFVEILDREPSRVSIGILTHEDSWLVLAESFHPGWKVTINGQPSAVYRACGDFMGCLVGPDTKQVEFVFAPDSLHYGKLLSSSGLGLWLCILIASLWTHRSRKTDP